MRDRGPIHTGGTSTNKIILFMHYLALGTMMHMLFTMPYTYERLPSYNMVAIFSLIGIIPNLRFLIAPFIENHTSLAYGKRKTWMVISTFFEAIILFGMSYFVRENQQIELGLLFTILKLFVGTNHTSIDALALKEYNEKSRVSFLQTTVLRLGGIVGSLLFLKLISPTFYVQFGLKEPFVTVQGFFRIISLVLLIVAVLSHFLYKEEESEVEEVIMKKSYCQLVRKYKVFFDIDTVYMRLIVFYFFYPLGVACFGAGFRYVLIQNHNVSREDYVTITTVMSIVCIPFAYFFSREIRPETIAWKLQIVIAIGLISDCFAFFLQIHSFTALCLFYFVIDLTMSFENIILHTILNNVSDVGLSGMYLSAAGSLKRVVENHSWSLKLIDVFGFQLCSIVGFMQQIAISYFVPHFVKWIDEGELPEEVKESDSDDQNE